MRARSALLAGIVLACFAVAPAEGDGIYRWVDEEGRVHFGDRPGQGRDVEAVGNQTEAPAGPRGAPPIDGVACVEFQHTPEFRRWPLREQYEYQNACARRHQERIHERFQDDTRRQRLTEERRRVRSWGDRYSNAEAKRLKARPHRDDDWKTLESGPRFGVRGPERPVRWDDESYCQGKYGKSCAELSTWRRTTIERCKHNHLARDCEDPAYLERKKPLTIEELRRKDAAKDRAYQERLRREQRRRAHGGR